MDMRDMIRDRDSSAWINKKDQERETGTKTAKRIRDQQTNESGIREREWFRDMGKRDRMRYRDK